MRDLQAGRLQRLKNERFHSSCFQQAGKLRLVRPYLKQIVPFFLVGDHPVY
jgi:hypothetical protein